jgi:hypothetical protein
MDNGQRSKAVVILSLTLCALMSLYVLSIGPVVYLESTGVIEYPKHSAIVGFYEPLFWAGRQYEPLKEALTWYMAIWAP